MLSQHVLLLLYFGPKNKKNVQKKLIQITNYTHVH